MGLFNRKELTPNEELLVANSNCVFKIESVLYPNVKHNGQRIADIGGRVLKGKMCVGDEIIAYDKRFKILKIQKAFDILQCIENDDYVGLVVAYEPITYYKLPFKKGVYKVVTPDYLEKENPAYEDCALPTQLKRYICARCKKEITDAESKWRGNHRFCADCATLPANNTLQKQKGQSVYNKNKSLCLCYYRKDEYEWYQVELQFNANNEILIVDTYYWPAHRGASNGGQSTTKLDADYFAKNTIDDFIVFLKNNYKRAKDFNQDFSALKNRDDIKALFENCNKTVQPQIKFADEQPLGLYRDKKYLHKLFDVYFNAEEQREKFVCYDTITGIPYLIDSQTRHEEHAIISSWYGSKLTYEQVALFAQNYAPTSPLSDISSDNWKEFFDIDNTTQHNPSTYTDSITRESNTAFLSNSGYLGSIVPIQLDWKDIEGSSRFYFACEPHFDEISIGLIKQGKYANQLFITIINDGYPNRSGGGGTVELLPERYRSYDGIKQYVSKRGFGIYNPMSEDSYNKSMQEL